MLEWIIDRCTGKAEAVDTPIGFLPQPDDIDLQGLEIGAETLEQLLAVDYDGWRAEVRAIDEYLDEYADRVPEALRTELDKLRAALGPDEPEALANTA